MIGDRMAYFHQYLQVINQIPRAIKKVDLIKNNQNIISIEGKP
jgi:hypothetical protein